MIRLFLTMTIFSLIMITALFAVAVQVPRMVYALDGVPGGTGIFNEMMYISHDGRAFGIVIEDNRAGLRVRVPTPCIGVETPTWSPDGTQIAYVGFCDGTRSVQVIDADGQNPRTVASRLNTINIGRPMWSPDGTRLAFQGRGAGSSNIYVVDLASGQVLQITGDRYSNYNPSWSPDGQSIVYEAYRTSADLMVYDFETRTERALTDFAGAERVPSWSPDGRMIAYEGFDTQNGNAGIFITDAITDANGASRRLVVASPSVFEPEWTPDSQMIYFNDTSDRHQIMAQDIDTGAIIWVTGYRPFYCFRP